VARLEEVVEAGDVDAILVCTPTTTHADLIERGARAGKAVFCEKPVDLSSARIETCLGIVEKAGIPLMIGFNRRFDPNFASLRRRLADGEVGEVELVTILSRDPGPPPVSYIATSGGLFRDMMIHDLDMARFLLLGDEPVEVHAVGSSLVDPAIGQAGDVDTAAVLLKTSKGRIVQISNSRRATYGYDQRIEVHGSKGMIRAGNIHRTTVEVANAVGHHRRSGAGLLPGALRRRLPRGVRRVSHRDHIGPGPGADRAATGSWRNASRMRRRNRRRRQAGAGVSASPRVRREVESHA
jgi:myo-inositol 2-dehydrogenase/D-chiro-inositol 1-dehydrogenase